jgi:hypothetical protein
MQEILTPHDYQDDAVRFGIHRALFADVSRGGMGFFHDPGMGKTAVTLMLKQALQSVGRLEQTLLIAPLRPVYSVWPGELTKWLRFNGIRYRIVHGSPEAKEQAIKSDAELLLLNAEGVHWMVKHIITQGLWQVPLKRVLSHLRKMDLIPLAGLVGVKGDVSLIAEHVPASRYEALIRNLDLRIPARWTSLVVDESSLFKNPDAHRFQALKSISGQFRYRSLLSGTPSPNGLMDLWAQIYLIDGGKALGPSISAYRTRYFNQGFRGDSWHTKDGAKEAIYAAIAHLIHRLDEKDHLNLPEMVINDIWVDLNTKAFAGYKKLEKELFVEIESAGVTASGLPCDADSPGVFNNSVVIGSAAAKYLNCRGYSNGGIYETPEGAESLDDRITHHIHTDKVKALAELIGELQGKPLIVAYQFKHDLERIRKLLPHAPVINGDVSGSESLKLINDWNDGKINILLVQPQSLSHGVNMQAYGNDICWFGLTDNLEIYLQLNKRLHRQGVVGTVRIHRILCRRTVDEAISARLLDKDSSQQALLRALKNYRLQQS